MLHRHPATVVYLAVQHLDGRFADISRRIGGLATGARLATLDADGLLDPEFHTYVTIHGFAPGAPRQNDHVACLNAVALDLDVAHNGPRDLTEAEAALDEVPRQGVVPVPNILVRSGRGFWLLWLLGTADNDPTPPMVTPEHTKRYKAVHRALCDQLQGFSPDRAAGDLARLMRLPGSYNAKTGDPSYRASFLERHDRVFTLDGLINSLGLSVEPRLPTASLPLRRLASPGSRAVTFDELLKDHGRSAGGLNRVKRPLDVALNLAVERGHVPEGQRHDWLFVVAHFLVRLCRNEGQQEQTLSALNETWCQPPEQPAQLGAILRGARRYRNRCGPKGMLSHKQVIARLRMTPEEQRRHGLCVPRVRGSHVRAREQAEREAQYQAVIEGADGVIPPARAMSIAIGRHERTVQRDYIRLGLRLTPGSHRSNLA